MTEVPGIAAAFAAGFLSFLSPCVLPLVPSYLAMLAGTSVAAVRGATGAAGAKTERTRVLARAAVFSLGFSAVFVALGIALSSAGAMLGGRSRLYSTIAGAVVVALGLNVAFDFTGFLNFEARFRLPSRPAGLAGTFLFGAAFAAGWSPCVGPILASILLMAGQGGGASALALLASYSAGLALPFLLAGAFFGRLEGLLAGLKKRMRTVKLVSGGLLVAIGSAMLLGALGNLNSVLTSWGWALSEAASAGTAKLPAALAWFAAAAFSAAAGLLRRRASKPALPAFVVAAAASAFGALEAAGVISTAGMLAAWLLFQGA